ncbi:MAG: VWA domain-containing protein, partial [Candidatus Binatia bacterium]
MGPSNVISNTWKIPKTSLVIFLFVILAGRAYGDDRGLGPTEIPTPDKPPPLSKVIPGPYKVLRSTAVYSQPREDSPKIVTIEPGTKVQVVNAQENWLEIQSKHGRAPGFIKKDSVIVKKKAPESALHGRMDRTKKMATGRRHKSAEPKVRITSPKEGAQINQDQEVILVSGKVSMGKARKPNVDIFFILDVSESTARYAGVDFGDTGLSTSSVPRRWGGGQIRVLGRGFGMGEPVMMDLRNSILAAEVAATRRFLSQLNSETTRVGLITFGARAEVLQPLTNDFERVEESLDEVLLSGPYGGTHMVG